MQTLKFNDVHVHINPFSKLNKGAFEFMSLNQDFKMNWKLIETNPEYIIKRMDEEGVDRMVIINYVAKDTIGYDLSVNEFAANYCKEYRDRLIPFGGVDLSLNLSEFINNIENCYSKLEIVGFKLHPVHQLIYPNQYREEFGALRLPQLEWLYEFANDNKIPLTVHTGTSMFPKARIKYGDPVYLDDVMVDFPKLKIIMAHGGRPFWNETAFYLLRRHSNLYLDISGIPPKNLLNYFPRISDIYERVMFGSDWPSPGVKGMRANALELFDLPLQDNVKYAILINNFNSFFGRG